MKKALIVSLFVLVMVLAGAQSAFALHGGYSATSNSCRSCHFVHQASGGKLFLTGEKINATFTASIAASSGAAAALGITTDKVTMNASSIAQDLCLYCHVYGTTDAVYQTGLAGGTLAHHSIGATDMKDGEATALMMDGNPGLGCIDCHNALPHSAGYERDSAKAGWWYLPNETSGRMYARDGSAEAFCERCHSKNTNAMALAGGTTHPIVTASESFETSNVSIGSQKIAFSDADSCFACHANYSFHGVDGSATATCTACTNYPRVTKNGSTKMSDGMCLSCHQSGAEGVALTY